MATTLRSRRRRSRAEAVGYAIGYVVVLTASGVAFDLAYAFLLALPVMFLTALLTKYGWPITALSYWQSWWVAFLLSWIINGAGMTRRAIEKD
jgi:hypothetical protein